MNKGTFEGIRNVAAPTVHDYTYDASSPSTWCGRIDPFRRVGLAGAAYASVVTARATPPSTDLAPSAPPGPPSGLELAPGVWAPESALRFQYARSGGPGGQNVNKLNTKAELWVPLAAITGLGHRALSRLRTLAGRRLTTAGEIHITAETERTQEGNRTAVLDRLRQLLLESLYEPKPRRKTKPSKAAKRRRLEAKRKRSEVKSRRRGGAGEW